MMKKCCKCKVEKPLTEFHKDRSASTGHSYRCRDCDRVAGRKWYHKRGKFGESFKARQRATQARYRERYPEKVRVQWFANRHRNKIMGSECESCGSTDKLHMHHPDYSKPLEVITLCNYCHAIIHSRRVVV